MAVGALGVATSGVFIDLSGAAPATATFFRCALALPLLWPLAEVRSYRVVLLSAAVVGALWPGVTFTPGWAALGWLALTAVCGQIGGWLLIALATAHLSSTVSAAMLMLTPVGALALAAVVLGEQPTMLQLSGCALILVSAYAASASGSGRRRITATVRKRLGDSRNAAA